MYNPLVSIVMPLYNGSNYVAQAIDCALAQTYQNVEIIVVNDGSTDGGAGRDICLSYGDKIRYFEKQNGGCASALNYGIRQAKGEFISWLSHDDLYDKEKIAAQIECYQKYSLDPQKTIISTPCRVIDENGELIPRPKLPKCRNLDSRQMFQFLLLTTNVNGCGLLIPKQLFENGVYFREDLRFVLDWNLWLKFAVYGAHMFVDDRILVSIRMHSQQVTVKQSDRRAPEVTENTAELFELLKKLNLPEYIQILYFYSISTNEVISKDIKRYMKENRISTKPFKKINYILKIKGKEFAKHIYRIYRKAARIGK